LNAGRRYLNADNLAGKVPTHLLTYSHVIYIVVKTTEFSLLFNGVGEHTQLR